MREIQKEIGQWHREKFGETTDELLSAIMAKVGEELAKIERNEFKSHKQKEKLQHEVSEMQSQIIGAI